MEKTVVLKIKSKTEAKIEDIRYSVLKLYGVIEIINIPNKNTLEVVYDDEFLEYSTVKLAVEKEGFAVIDSKEKIEESARGTLQKEKKRLIAVLFFTFIISCFSIVRFFSIDLSAFKIITPGVHTITTAFFGMLALIFGYGIYTSGFEAVKKRMPNADTLISISVFASFIFSMYSVYLFFTGSNRKTEGLYFLPLALLIMITLIGKSLSLKIKIMTDNTVKRLRSLQPKIARIIRNGEEVEISVDEVLVGDSVIVKPMEKIPADGIITSGYTTVDESILTGDITPIEKQKGSKVIGASINKKGYFTFKVTKTGDGTILSQIIKLVTDAKNEKREKVRFPDTLSYYLIPTILLLAITTSFFWFVLTRNFIMSLSAFFSVIIISCPSAVALAAPFSIIAATKMAKRLGVIFKNTDVIETLYKTDIIMFDKTGTLTEGSLRITDIISSKENYALALAGALKRGEEDPLSVAIVSLAYERKIKLPQIFGFNSYPGYGVQAYINGKNILVGNKKFMETSKISLSDYEIRSKILLQEGKYILYISEGGKLIGLIGLLDSIKKESFSAIQDLHEMKIKTVMLTSENKKNTRMIAKNIGIENIISDAMPKNKDYEIKKNQSEGKIVAMVGDGVNDAAALTQADIGIAVGSAKEIAIESADVVLEKSNIKDVITAIDISKAAVFNIKQNLFLSIVFNILCFPIASGLIYAYKDNISYYFISDVISYMTENTMLLTPQMVLVPLILSLIFISINTLRFNGFKQKKHDI